MSILISTPFIVGPGSIGTSELVDGSVTAAKVGSGNAGDGQVLTADGSGGAAWEAPAGGGPGYLEYVALLSQSGTNAPVATVLKNTIGAIVWQRDKAGAYSCMLSESFPINKTVCFGQIQVNGYDPQKSLQICAGGGGNYIYIYTVTSGASMEDECLANASIEIRVYP